LVVQLSTQTNGRHERLHRTLKQELVPAEDRRAQQRELERFRQEYNQVRPHEALAMQTPASVYEPSPRAYPARVPEPEYPSSMLVRSVKYQGVFRWKKHDVFLTQVLWGECIGLLPRDERWFTIYFAHWPLAEFDSAQLRIVPRPNSIGFAMDGAGEEVECTLGRDKKLVRMNVSVEDLPQGFDARKKALEHAAWFACFDAATAFELDCYEYSQCDSHCQILSLSRWLQKQAPTQVAALFREAQK